MTEYQPRAGENVLEHFTQFFVYLVMGLLSWSKTGTVTNISELFVSRIDTFLVISAIFSLVREDPEDAIQFVLSSISH